MKDESPEITITTNDASVMKVVQQIDGVEVDVTPAPVEAPVIPDKKNTLQGIKEKANDKDPA